MKDQLPDTCSTRVPITLRKTFGAESKNARKERKDTIARLKEGMREYGFTPDLLKTRLSKMKASKADTLDEVTLHYWAPGSQYPQLEIHVLSEPNSDSSAEPEDRCIVQYQFHQWELPDWLQPWELTIGNGS